MNLSHNKLTHRKVRVERYRYIHPYENEKPIIEEEWRPRKWFDVTVGIVMIAAIILAICGTIFGIGAGFYRISEVECHHKAEKYEVDNWSYGLSTGCNFEVDGKWMDVDKYPPVHVKVE